MRAVSVLEPDPSDSRYLGRFWSTGLVRPCTVRPSLLHAIKCNRQDIAAVLHELGVQALTRYASIETGTFPPIDSLEMERPVDKCVISPASGCRSLFDVHRRPCPAESLCLVDLAQAPAAGERREQLLHLSVSG